jgi:hypothetical protein
MTRMAFSGLSQPSRRLVVYGSCRVFLALDQGVGGHQRSGRLHQGCIGCEENTRQGPLTTNSAANDELWIGRQAFEGPSSGSARIASSRLGRALLDRATLAKDRADPRDGPEQFLLSCGSGRHPDGRKPR